ncbi:lysophospholipid acyltransferase family protein [uncultured Candidatus Puniceispirillum sp.]|jgi:1-acyl-sn-glycerol-3-phosphate acyltransferase|uniref:lysophospholipid acyltransferase family protein n=2 Tax=Candidatus Puniceispirillum TaxID=767891 RepID=UPI0032B30388
MVYLRSFLFNSLFYLMTTLIVVLFLPLLLLPRQVVWWVARFWGWTTSRMLYICGIDHDIKGAMHLDETVIYAAKHQSAWETIVLYAALRAPITVMKRELLFLPFIGFFFLRSGCIAVNRSGGMKALRELRATALRIRDNPRSILIFPQGTRVMPRTHHDYQIGVFTLYDTTGFTVVPIALDSGRVWPRNSWMKFPGRVNVRFLDPIEPGLTRKQFMSTLETRIESEVAILEANEVT